MYCIKCGNKLSENTNYCTYCGKKINVKKNNIKKCPFCKEIISRDVNICPHCERIFVEKIGKNKPTKDYYQKNTKTNFLYQPNKKSIFSNINFKIIIILFVIFVGYLIFSEDNLSVSDSSTTKPTATRFPELVEPKIITFNWKYNRKKYEISETFYNSVYQYYQAQPKEYTYYENELPDNWTEDYYKMYLNVNENDNSYSNLLSDIKNEAEKNNLTEDETVELILTFVQSIPYDDDLASEILYGVDNVGPKYAYEVLYDNSGVCGGKSFLAYILLKKLGYGTVLFKYEEDKHLAVGIKCPEKYSTYNSGYCFAETTTPGHLIGIIPEYNPNDVSVIAKNKFSYFGENTSSIETNQLGEGKIILKSEGKIYNGVKENIEIYNKIETLEGEIYEMEKSLKLSENNINFNQNKLEKLDDNLDYYDSANFINLYNNLVPEYNQLLKTMENLIDKHNNEIIIFNNKVNEINSLINDLY